MSSRLRSGRWDRGVRLAEAGLRVLVLEAGADASAVRAEGLPEDYDVPASTRSPRNTRRWPGTNACSTSATTASVDRRRRLRPARRLSARLHAWRLHAHHAMILIATHHPDWG
jgi:choline dehydrogenase-like flavoprotein